MCFIFGSDLIQICLKKKITLFGGLQEDVLWRYVSSCCCSTWIIKTYYNITCYIVAENPKPRWLDVKRLCVYGVPTYTYIQVYRYKKNFKTRSRWFLNDLLPKFVEGPDARCREFILYVKYIIIILLLPHIIPIYLYRCARLIIHLYNANNASSGRWKTA